ncbi:MAG TPA: EamA family transporter, partial [Vicinamibacteria bacterium]
MESSLWLVYAVITTAFWGVWGAFIEVPEKKGFPATLGYVVWSLTMLPCAAVALFLVGFEVAYDPRSILLGSAAGLLGAGGQLVLFETLRRGPAYLVFPVVALSPVISVVLSVVLLGEEASGRAWAGIVLALLALPLLAYQPAQAPGSGRGRFWLGLSVAVLFAWGIQAYVLRFANETMSAESIFFYMAATAVALAPVAYLMTDFSKPVNLGPSGPWLAAAIQLLNSIGALTMVYAFRYGKVIIVSPMINALAPVL